MRENQLDSYKTKIKPVLGKSINDAEFTNIVKKENKEFENITNLKDEDFNKLIEREFKEFRNKRSEAITEKVNLELEKKNIFTNN